MSQNAVREWVRANCHPQIQPDVARLADEAFEKGWDCWFFFGDALTRKQAAFLLHQFAAEVFVFELTSSQAKAGGIRPKTMIAGSSPCDLAPCSGPVSVLIERFELQQTVLRYDQPIKARIDVNSATPFTRPFAVRLGCQLGKKSRTMWVYPNCPLIGRVSLNVEFEPLASIQHGTIEYVGPAAIFVSLVEIPDSSKAGPDRPISDIAAVLAQVKS